MNERIREAFKKKQRNILKFPYVGLPLIMTKILRIFSSDDGGGGVIREKNKSV